MLLSFIQYSGCCLQYLVLYIHCKASSINIYRSGAWLESIFRRQRPDNLSFHNHHLWRSNGMCTRRRSPWSQFTLPACLPARLSTSQRTTDHRPIRLFVRVHPAGVVLSASLYVYAQNSRFFTILEVTIKTAACLYVAKLVGWLALLNVEVFLLLEFGKSADILFRGAGTWICLFLILLRWF